MPSQPNQPPGKRPTRAKRLWSAIKKPFRWTEKRAIEPFANYLDQADIFRIVEKLSPVIEAFGIIAIPIVIWWMTDSGQKAKEDTEKAARAQEDKLEQAARAQEAVKTYLNQLSTVFLTGNLEKDEKLRTVTRASTLALFNDPNLKGTHKGQVIAYLDELNLIQIQPRLPNSQDSKPTKPIISLAKADLSGAILSDADLSGAILSGAILSNADLKKANFSKANLKFADLEFADLKFADLFDADLSDANLTLASLFNASLNYADLNRADLRFTDLRDADLRDADPSLAKLCQTTLPPSIKLDSNRDCKELGLLVP